MKTHTVQDIMHHQVPSITSTSELTQAVEQLQKHGLFGAPVVDKQHRLIGFISEQQLLAPLLNNSYFCDGQVLVKDIMSTEVLSVNRHTQVVDLASQMQGDKPKIYPVVESDRVVGVVTRSQVINALKVDFLSCNNPESHAL